jgi:hypothetical protein
MGNNQSEQQGPIGPEAQAAKLAALANPDTKQEETTKQSPILEGAGSWQAATPEQRKAHVEAIAEQEIKDAEVLQMCEEDPALEEIRSEGERRQLQSESRDWNIVGNKGAEWSRDERAKKAGIRAVKFALLQQGVLDSHYIRKEKAA